MKGIQLELRCLGEVNMKSRIRDPYVRFCERTALRRLRLYSCLTPFCLTPFPRRHRHHYHGVFAPNAPLRPMIETAANQTPKILVPPEVQQTANDVTKVSLTWSKLIARTFPESSSAWLEFPIPSASAHFH